MTSPRRFFLHMGLPKCASTSLQDSLVHAEEFLYLGKTTGGAFHKPEIAEFTRVVAVFGDVRIRDCSTHRASFSKAISESPFETVWLSDEVLSSAGFAAYGHSNSLPQILENFKRVIPVEIEPVIVVRNQWDLLRSYYQQWIQFGSSETYEEFVRYVFLRRDRFIFPILNYVNLARVLKTITPTVHVLCFEALTRDPAYRAARFAGLGVGEISDRFGQTHSRPGLTENEIRTALAGRLLPGCALGDSWAAKSHFADLYAYQPVTTAFGRSVMRVLADRPKAAGEANALAVREKKVLTHPVYDLPEQLATMISGYMSRANESIEFLDPDIDWRALGY